jgi:L-threonylcarbamoyladenylate synthase
MVRLSISPASPDPVVIAQAADTLRRHGIVAYPTDTLYGLAADPRSDDAVEKIYAVKGRSARSAIPLIASDLQQVHRIARLGIRDLELARAFWPGPLTIVLPATGIVAPTLLAGGATVAVRVPAHPVARALAAALGCCITATSANMSGHEPAASADQVLAALGSSVDLVLDGGLAPGGLPSTIVEMTSDGPRLVRAGAVAWERVLESLQ